MASKSKFLPFVAVAVALTFLWCYLLPNMAFASAGSGELGTALQTSTRIEAPFTGAENPSCKVCQSVIENTAKSDMPPAGHIGTPVYPSSESASESAIAPFLLSLASVNSVFSKRYALHRSSLFHQAILIRI